MAKKRTARKKTAKRQHPLRDPVHTPWFRKAWQEYALQHDLQTEPLYAVGDGPPVPPAAYEVVCAWIAHRLKDVKQ